MSGGFSLKLDRTLRAIVKTQVVYSTSAPSRRILGQFGAETVSEHFSCIKVYIQFGQATSDFHRMKELISECVYRCRKVNQSNIINFSNFLFSEGEGELKLLDKYMFLGSTNGEEAYNRILASFRPSDNNRILNRLVRGRPLDRNALLVFITDHKGCAISDATIHIHRGIERQSIWIRISDDKVDVTRGLPRIEGE
jgi:hypothetical protein